MQRRSYKAPNILLWMMLNRLHHAELVLQQAGQVRHSKVAAAGSLSKRVLDSMIIQHTKMHLNFSISSRRYLKMKCVIDKSIVSHSAMKA